jgi:hypothetical protein
MAELVEQHGLRCALCRSYAQQLVNRMVYPRIVSTDVDDLICKICFPSLACRA